MSPWVKASANENRGVDKVRWGLNPVEEGQGMRKEKPKVTPKATLETKTLQGPGSHTVKQLVGLGAKWGHHALKGLSLLTVPAGCSPVGPLSHTLGPKFEENPKPLGLQGIIVTAHIYQGSVLSLENPRIQGDEEEKE